MKGEQTRAKPSSVYKKMNQMKRELRYSLEQKPKSKSGPDYHSIVTVLIFTIILIISITFSPALDIVYGSIGVEDVDPMVSEVDIEIKEGYYHVTIGLYDRNTWRSIDEATIELYRDGRVSRRYVFDLAENRSYLFTIDSDRVIEIGGLFHGKTDLSGLRDVFEDEGYSIKESDDAFLSDPGLENIWALSDGGGERIFFIEKNEDNLEVHELPYSIEVEKGSGITYQWLNVNTAFGDEPRDRSEMELTLKFPAGNHDWMRIEVEDQAGNTGQSVVYFRTLISGKDRPIFVGIFAALLTGLVIFKIRYESETEINEYELKDQKLIKKESIKDKSNKVKTW